MAALSQAIATQPAAPDVQQQALNAQAKGPGQQGARLAVSTSSIPGSAMSAKDMEAFETGLRQLMDATASSQYKIVYPVGSLNDEALQVVSKMQDAFQKSAVLMIASESDRERLQKFGINQVRVVAANSKESLDKQLTGISYTVLLADGKMPSGARMAQSILEANDMSKRAVILSPVVTKSVGPEALYAPYIVKDKVAAVIGGQLNEFSREYRSALSGFQSLIQWVKTPWKALESLYQSLQAVSQAA